jgi:hypothetical protein
MPGYSFDVEAFCNEVASDKTAPGNDSEAAEKSTPSTKPTLKPNSDWNLISQAMDRILFVIYLLIILLFLAAYIGGVANSEASNIYASGFSP